jgi:hypothetical protein
MPEVLDTFDFSGGSSRYNWDELLDGQIRRLVHGTDFEVKASSVVATARKQAAKRGKDLNIRTDGENVVLQGVEQAS